MITIQVGSNDQCALCGGIIVDHVTDDAYDNYVEAAIKRVKAEILRVVANLFKLLHCNQAFSLM